MSPHHFLVGTFNTPAVFTLAFDPSKRSLDVVAKSEATGAHSWLSLNVRLSRSSSLAAPADVYSLTGRQVSHLRHRLD